MIRVVFLICCSLIQTSCVQSQEQNNSNAKDKAMLLHLYNTTSDMYIDFGVKLANKTFAELRWAKHPKLKAGGELRKAIDTLRYKTVTILDSIERVKRQLINRVGGGISIKNHSLVTPMRKVAVAQYMIKERKAYQVEKWLNEYVNFLNTEYKKFGIPTLYLTARVNGKSALYMNDPIMRKKDFAHAHFDQVPVIMAVTYLSLFQNMVFRYQEEVQKYIIWSLVDKK